MRIDINTRGFISKMILKTMTINCFLIVQKYEKDRKSAQFYTACGQRMIDFNDLDIVQQAVDECFFPALQYFSRTIIQCHATQLNSQHFTEEETTELQLCLSFNDKKELDVI